MTEQEWLTCTDPTPMLEFLGGEASGRQLRLFACACCGQVGNYITDGRLQEAVRTAERFADGKASEEELRHAAEGAEEAYTYLRFGRIADDGLGSGGLIDGQVMAAIAVQETVAGDNMVIHAPYVADSAAEAIACETVGAPEKDIKAKNDHCRRQCVFVRDVFGNPFRPVSLDPSWRTPSVVNLANAIYDNRAFECLPLLAGAVEEVGCRDAELLAHCRAPGPHVRGCCVVDLILGKK
jgi:hypothetical protein